MARVKRVTSSRSSALGLLKRRAETAMNQLRRVGMREARALEKRIATLSEERDKLLAEIGVAFGRRPSATSRRGRRSEVDWEKIFAKLPKTSFRASDVKKMVPQIAGGTLSQRLTKWVKEKKLKRSGTRRGTRYVRSA